MRFRDPWIDPRIFRLGPEEARAYLLRHGWKPLGPASNPILEMFKGPGDGEDSLTVLVPLKSDQGPTLQRMIDLVGQLARFEDRWAVDVLIEMLEHSRNAVSTGPNSERHAKSAVP